MTQFCAKVQKPYFWAFISPDFAPIFRGEGVEIEKNCPHQSESTFHQLFKYEIRFSKSLAVVLDIAILCQVQKSYFCPFLGPFCPKSREREFSQIWDFCRKLANHNTLHFKPFPATTNDSVLHKCSKSPFLDPFFWENENFPKKSGSVTLES